MTLRALFVLLVLFLPRAAVAEGTLVIIGGGPRPDVILQTIVEAAGGKESRLVIVPIASSEPREVGDYQRDQLLQAGAGRVDVLIFDRAEADSDALVARLDGVTGVFFSGGDQRRLAAGLLGSRLLERIRQIHRGGGVVAGTSAGAAVMGPIMITGDEASDPEDDDPESGASFETVQAQNVITTEGFGLWPGVIVDQHFLRRKRQNRLLSLVLEHPSLPAVGIDEATAVVVRGDGFRVIGESLVQVYDGREARIFLDEPARPAVFDLRTHLLRPGQGFEVSTGRPLAAEPGGDQPVPASGKR